MSSTEPRAKAAAKANEALVAVKGLLVGRTGRLCRLAGLLRGPTQPPCDGSTVERLVTNRLADEAEQVRLGTDTLCVATKAFVVDAECLPIECKHDSLDKQHDLLEKKPDSRE